MRLFVSTVVAVVVLALWLPATADLHYAVTAAEHVPHEKSYTNLLFATGVTLYVTAGLFSFGSAAPPRQAVHPTTTRQSLSPLRQRGPCRARAGRTAAGGYKRPQKTPLSKTKQQPARPTSKRTLPGSLSVEGHQVPRITGNLAQNSPQVEEGTAAPGVAVLTQAHAVNKKLRRRLAAKKLASAVCELGESCNAFAGQVDAEDEAAAGAEAAAEAEQPATARQWQVAAGRCDPRFNVAPFGRRWCRLTRPQPHGAAQLAAGAGGRAAVKQLPPQGRLVTIEEQLPSLQRTLQYVPGEGNCQFCSVSMVLEGSWENHLQLRQRVCDHMAHNAALFAPFVSSSSLAGYLQDMRQPCSWGDELTLTAMADLLRRELRVVTDHHAGEQGVHRYTPLAGPATSEALYMWFRNGHYNPLLPW